MEPLAGAVRVAGWVAMTVFGARRVARGHRRWAWVFFGPVAIGLLSVVWIAIRSWSGQPVLAIALGLIGIPSLVLFLRSARKQAADVLPEDPTWTLSSAQFDYIVWTAIGLPFLVVLLLLVLLVTGGLSTAQ
jgi:hypothetical protein